MSHLNWAGLNNKGFLDGGPYKHWTSESSLKHNTETWTFATIDKTCFEGQTSKDAYDAWAMLKSETTSSKSCERGSDQSALTADQWTDSDLTLPPNLYSVARL